MMTSQLKHYLFINYLLFRNYSGIRKFWFGILINISVIFIYDTSKASYTLDRSLMMGWRKNILKPSVLCIHFRVYLCVYVSVRGLQSTPFDIGTYFLGWVILGTGEKRIFLSSKFSFLRFLLSFFDFFPYITLVKFLFQANGHSFSPRTVIFGLR